MISLLRPTSFLRHGSISAARAVMALLLALLSGCANYTINPLEWFGDDEIDPPAELISIVEEVDLRPRWSVNVGNGQGGNYTKINPIIDNNTLYVASENGNLVAIDTATGEIRWRQEVDQTITGGVGAGEGVVMFGTEEAEVVVLSQADGTEIWRSAVSSEVLSAPQTNGDVVVAQTVDGKLVALNHETGEQRWIYETTLPALTLRGTSSPVITRNGIAIAGFSNGTLISLRAEDGVLLWEERVAIPEGRYDIDRVIDVDGNLLLDGQRVLASSYQGNIMAFDIQSGRIVWGREASSYHGLDQGFGNIYYCDDKSHIVAVRDNSDDVAWENEDLHNRSITAPTAIGNYVAVADYEGYVHLLSQIDGRIIGRTKIDDDGVRANMLANDGTLYVYGNSGRLTALALQ
ncbi:MAG TPA: outer membrane protein assembly factor BamB [Porticoccaceae bacterium]|nr:outer membrane protein assembly factor BamB [Gammaproteobacteria bacterium]HIL59652.1 outer membrane protein assembly factor BamB [Porticoccaceae bacterium]